jgi:hypothetical protein
MRLLSTAAMLQSWCSALLLPGLLTAAAGLRPPAAPAAVKSLALLPFEAGSGAGAALQQQKHSSMIWRSAAAPKMHAVWALIRPHIIGLHMPCQCRCVPYNNIRAWGDCWCTSWLCMLLQLLSVLHRPAILLICWRICHQDIHACIHG